MFCDQNMSGRNWVDVWGTGQVGAGVGGAHRINVHVTFNTHIASTRFTEVLALRGSTNVYQNPKTNVKYA